MKDCMGIQSVSGYLDQAMEDYDALYEFLESHQYPTGYTKNRKRSLKRKAQKHFQARNGILYYSKEPASSQGTREWKHVPRSVIDKERILKSSHDNHAQGETAILNDTCRNTMMILLPHTGGHFGRDKTQKIAETLLENDVERCRRVLSTQFQSNRKCSTR